jgi:hypothetical protein
MIPEAFFSDAKTNSSVARPAARLRDGGHRIERDLRPVELLQERLADLRARRIGRDVLGESEEEEDQERGGSSHT